jgi:cell division protein ZapA
LARALEKKINTLVESNNVSTYNASVMVAMALLDDLKHLDKEYSKLQVSTAEVDKLREQRDTALREIKRLNAKITQLEDSQRFKELGGVIPEYYTNPSSKPSKQ